MIAYLSGKIINRTEKYIILLVSGVGYEVFLPEKFISKVQIDQDLEVYLYHKQREDAQELYGFESLKEREFFTKLISVSGVGPKSALAVLSIADVDNLSSAIATGNAEIFKKVSGIGTKTAERIVVELKSKVGALASMTEASNEDSGDIEVFEALSALGFADNDIRSVYSQLPANLETTSDKIKAALKLLKK
jgi:Holliday junction DNA helicase RuvA